MFWSSLAYASTFMPPQASTVAASVDRLYIFLLIISFIASVLVIGGMVYFIFKYKRKSEDEFGEYISHNTLAEFLWSFIPLVLFMVSFVWGWKVYHEIRYAPENSMEIFVKGYKWAWEFEYKNGFKSAGELYVPVGQPVKLIMTSSDVIHSFFIPSFRVKQDVVPGMYTSLWFEVKEPGEYQVFCAEYCGLQHSAMSAKVIALPQEEFDAMISGRTLAELSPAQLGERLYVSRNCNACHSIDGSSTIGPSFKGAYGVTRQFTDGTSGLVDENYLRESILEPAAKIVVGYSNVMPSYQGILNESEIMALIEFIKTLKE